jgi:hypothetical protein
LRDRDTTELRLFLRVILTNFAQAPVRDKSDYRRNDNTMTQVEDIQGVTTVRISKAVKIRRPRLPESLCVKLSIREKHDFNTAANEQGLLISELARQIIDQYLEEYFRNKKL